MIQDFKQVRIRKNHRFLMPRSVLYFDTETYHRTVGDEEHHRMNIAWSCLSVYDKNSNCEKDSWKYHNNTHELCRYIEKCLYANQGLYLIAHNIFFDLQVSDFFYYFTLWGYRLNFYYEAGLTYILVVVKDKHFLRCLSSTNWFDTNLKGLGDLIGLKKLDVDFELDDRDTIIEYCHRDVEIVKLAMEYYYSFVMDNGLGQFSLTKASQAFHAYRHRFMNVPIYCHQDKKVRKLERQAYFGGRVECFEVGNIKKPPFVYLDINSMYPYVMLNSRVPVKLIKHTDHYSIDKLSYILDKFCATAEVDLVTDKPAYAVRVNNKIIFPVGEFTTYLCSEGLRYAIKNNHLKNIRQIAIYRSDKIFTDYVNFFYALKLKYTHEHQPVLRELTKKMLNSLYGKFAQRRPITIEREELSFDGFYREEIFNLVTGEKGLLYKMFNTVVEQYGFEETDLTFTAISAHITENARMLLWSIIDDLGYDKVLYCDTDSIMIRKTDMGSLNYPVDSDTLGALNLEREINKLDIWGAKSYVMDNQRVFKGVPKTAIDLGNGRFKYMTFLRQDSHMRHEINRWYVLKETVKKIMSNYDKGIIKPSGRVRPFHYAVNDSGDIVVT